MERKRKGDDVVMTTTKLPDGGRKVAIESVTTQDALNSIPGATVLADEQVAASTEEIPDTEGLPSLAEILVAEDKNPEPVVTDVRNEPAAAPKTPVIAVCAACGHKHGDPLPEVTETDKRYFVESLLGARAFEKTYTFLGGGLGIGYMMPTRENADTGYKLLQWCARVKGTVVTETDERDMNAKIAVAMSVHHVEVGGSHKLRPPVVPAKHWLDMEAADYEVLLTAVMDRVKEMDKKYPFAALGAVKFYALYNFLVMHALDENFWTGVSLA
jgi:hypothetical protein